MFKIDLIVWKWFLFTIPNFYLSMFKIDLIVWKSFCISNIFDWIIKFKIDLIVWKSYTEEWDKIPSISLK